MAATSSAAKYAVLILMVAAIIMYLGEDRILVEDIEDVTKRHGISKQPLPKEGVQTHNSSSSPDAQSERQTIAASQPHRTVVMKSYLTAASSCSKSGDVKINRTASKWGVNASHVGPGMACGQRTPNDLSYIVNGSTQFAPQHHPLRLSSPRLPSPNCQF